MHGLACFTLLFIFQIALAAPQGWEEHSGNWGRPPGNRKKGNCKAKTTGVPTAAVKAVDFDPSNHPWGHHTGSATGTLSDLVTGAGSTVISTLPSSTTFTPQSPAGGPTGVIESNADGESTAGSEGTTTASSAQTTDATTTSGTTGDISGDGGSGSTPDDVSSALALHNSIRSKYGMSPLTWDNALASSAQAYATQAAGVHSHTSGQGENLWGSTAGGNVVNPLTSASKGWISEEGAFQQNYEDDVGIPCGLKAGSANYTQWETYGHIGQIIWGPTTKVGLGTYNGQVVGRYVQPGNMQGQTISGDQLWFCSIKE